MPIGALPEPRVVLSRPPERLRPSPSVSSPSPPPNASPSAFAKLLGKVELRVRDGESTLRDAIAAARGGQAVPLPELIAIQAGVYRYSETVDLVARLVDHATTGMKTVLQGQ